jgi:addiction module HigA family antidote
MVRLPTHRAPIHPGEALREDFLPDAGLTQSDAAARLKMSFRRLNEIINERRRVTPDTALRLGRLFGQSPEFWMQLQVRWDLYHALHSKAARDLDKIRPVAAA